MPSVTAIYVCKLGQDLKKGELFTSGSIKDRADAELDARDRCRDDHRIAKIGCYAMTEGGNFKTLLIYENPDGDLSPAPSAKSDREELIAAAQKEHTDVQASEKPCAGPCFQRSSPISRKRRPKLFHERGDLNGIGVPAAWWHMVKATRNDTPRPQFELLPSSLSR